MANFSSINPISYLTNRQYNEHLNIKHDLFSRRFQQARNLFRKDLLSHYGCVNAIEFSQEGELLISGGDDRRVLLWSVPHAILNKGQPIVMLTPHLSNIFCLGFDSNNSKIFSAGNDDQLIVHDIKTGFLITNFLHDKPVYGLSVSPQDDNVFASAGEDGRVLIYDIRETSTADPLCLARYKTAFHAVMFNPIDSRYIATANTEEGIALWDNRKPKHHVIRYGNGIRQQNSGMSVRFNSQGNQILALRRRLPPVLYNVDSEYPVCQFYHPDYYNSCTMKSCSFAGENDEYVLSGSDDFNLYMWTIPKNTSQWGSIHMVLQGHRSIVNQVRYNKQNNLIASSGVEKMVKLWSTLAISEWDGSLLHSTPEKPRQVFSHEEYISLVQNNGQLVSHDYSHQSTQEDSRMMAFFDSLVQREIEGWVISDDTQSSDSDYDSSSNLNQVPRSTPRSFSPDHKKLNRIAQLIFEKRRILAKMARRRYMHKKRISRRKRKLNKKTKKIMEKFMCKKSTSMSTETTTSSPKPDTSPHKHKYETRSHSARERERGEISSESLDVPSTSTGITSSNSLYRIYDQDSEDDTPSRHIASPEPIPQLINILPTPLNGTHDMYINILQVPVNNTNGVITVRNETYQQETDSDSDLNAPSKFEASTPDSGIVTGQCSSTSVNSGSSGSRYLRHQDDSDDPDWLCENFKKRAKRARLNIKNSYCDSDSNTN